MPMISEATPIAFSDPLPEAVDVVVIGAGVVGVSTAYFLAKNGVRVLVCEKGRVAGEQSSRNWGWVRQQGRDPAELPIAMEANRIWRGLAEETGERDLAFTACGCLYVTSEPARMARWEEWRESAARHQLESRMLTGAQVEALVPDLNGRWAGGIHTPSDGRAEPFVAVPALARAARRLGAAVIESCAVRTVESEAGRVRAVHTERGRVGAQGGGPCGWGRGAPSSPRISVSTSRSSRSGPRWVGRIRSTGPRCRPSTPSRCASGAGRTGATRSRPGTSSSTTWGRDRSGTSPSSGPCFAAAPATFDSASGPPRGYPGSWTGRRRWTAEETSPFEATRVLNPPPSEIAMRRITARLPVQAPRLAEAGMAEYWAGMIDVTPDAVPYLCEVPSPRGLFIGTGMSGHGFGIGPGAGRVLADLVQGRPHGHDLARFRFERFSDGSPIVPGPY